MSRDHLNVAVPGAPPVVDLHAIELVLEPLVAVGRAGLARIRVVGYRRGRHRQAAGRWRVLGEPAFEILGGVAHVASAVSASSFDLPHGLQPRRGVDAERRFDQLGPDRSRDLTLPHIEVGDMPARGRKRRRVGIVRLLVVVQRLSAKQLREFRIPTSVPPLGAWP